MKQQTSKTAVMAAKRSSPAPSFAKTVLQAALSLAVLAAASAQAASVQLQSPSALQVGQTIDLQLQVSNAFEQKSADEELLYFGFKLDYDHSRLKFSGFEVAAGWDDDSGFLGADEFGGSHFPGLANQAQALLSLANLRFELLSEGPAEIKLYSAAGNLSHGLGYAISEAQAFSLNPTLQISAAVPEPTTAYLGVLGLLLLAGQQRRRSQAAL